MKARQIKTGKVYLGVQGTTARRVVAIEGREVRYTLLMSSYVHSRPLTNFAGWAVRELSEDEIKAREVRRRSKRYHTWKCQKCGKSDIRTRTESPPRRPCPTCLDRGDKTYEGYR